MVGVGGCHWGATSLLDEVLGAATVGECVFDLVEDWFGLEAHVVCAECWVLCAGC